MNILLIGPRGSGKSTVGRLLAQRMRRPFFDLDERVLASFALRTVVEVWATHGEQSWRDAEVRCLRNSLQFKDQVIALGGGVVMIPAARAMIEEAQRLSRVKVVYLRCSADTLLARLREHPGDRPALSNAPIESEIVKILAQREPTYMALADLVANGCGRIEDVAEALARELD